METHRSWLPVAAIERGVRAVPLRQVVGDWSAKWFATGAARLCGDPVVATALDTPGGGWELADGVLLVPAAEIEPVLVALLFGPRDTADPLTPADEAVLQAVAEACLADLRTRLATAFRLPTETPWRPVLNAAAAARRWVWRVEADRGTALLRIAVEEALIARRLRAGLPPAIPDHALSPLAAALARQPIDVSALIGRCRLTTAELGGLGEGDVVVLDRTLGDAVSLAVDAAPIGGSCTVDERDGHLVLTLANR